MVAILLKKVQNLLSVEHTWSSYEKFKPRVSKFSTI